MSDCVSKWASRGVVFGLALLVSTNVIAGNDRVVVAAASNFSATAEMLARAFEEKTGQAIVVVAGSSGKHFAQIVSGAPFDILLSADQQKPAALLAKRLLSEPPRTYAIGRLVAWSANACPSKRDLAIAINGVSDGKIAIANPAVAPYGAAANDVLAELQVPKVSSSSIVFGENVSQVFQFAVSGNVDFAFLAQSHWINNPMLHARGCHWLVPERLHRPIIQQAGLLARAQDNIGANGFYRFLFSETAKQMIRQSGFETNDTANTLEDRQH